MKIIVCANGWMGTPAIGKSDRAGCAEDGVLHIVEMGAGRTRCNRIRKIARGPAWTMSQRLNASIRQDVALPRQSQSPPAMPALLDGLRAP